MIKPSDINISVSKNTKSYRADTIVEANLALTETATVYVDWANDPKVIEKTKDMVKHALYRRIYGELRDSIEEMYALAMINIPYGQAMDKVKELKGQIDQIMRGRNENE